MGNKINFDDLTQEEKDWIFFRGQIIDYVKFIFHKNEEEYFGYLLPLMWNPSCLGLMNNFIKDNKIILQNNQTLYSYISHQIHEYEKARTHSNNRNKILCIKDVNVFKGDTKFFKDKIYEIDSGGIIHSPESGMMNLSDEIFKEYFIYLSEYRDEQINEILS